jgi:GNAT superfamily N-acetyltransferase
LITDALSKTSQESMYLRFFSAKTTFSDDEMSKATEVDSVNVVALVAVLEENGEKKIVGGGRYLRTPTGAEVAFLVQDDYHGLGIGSRIFKHLIIIARTAGITQFEAEVLPGNKGMLTLFSRSGLPITQSRTSDAVHLKMALTTSSLPIRSRARIS